MDGQLQRLAIHLQEQLPPNNPLTKMGVVGKKQELFSSQLTNANNIEHDLFWGIKYNQIHHYLIDWF
jgi:hypothetical protein